MTSDNSLNSISTESSTSKPEEVNQDIASSDLCETPLELNKKNLKKGLLQYNYFPRTHDQKEEMPPFFGSEDLTSEVVDKLMAINLSKPRRQFGYDIMHFRRTRHPNIPRIMGIPHPRAYVALVDDITKNWDSHIKDVCQSENSNLTFEVQSDFRIMIHNYNRSSVNGEIENQDPSLDFGMSYRVETDITNFYHSIYSHSLPWALAGHKSAKKNRDSSLWFNKLDMHTRHCQRNETKGIPIGPATSSILSEIILFQVDKALREKGYKFSRYIDDYTAFTEVKAKADAFLVDLSKELEKYVLSLNPKKTTIIEMPLHNKEKWVTEINLFLSLNQPDSFSDKKNDRKKLGFGQLRMIIDKALSLSAEYPDGSVMKYAFSSILDIGVQEDGAEKYLQDTLLKYAYYYPSLIPLINKWIGCHILHFDIDDRLHKLYRHSLEQGQSDNAVWCIFYLMRNIGFINHGLLGEVCKDEAPMVMLMGYIYAKEYKLKLDPIKAWANEKIVDLINGDVEEYDIDRHWLVFYQLYFDDVLLAPPYRDVLDNKIFELMKEEGVSFINYEHEDLKSPLKTLF